MKGKLKLFGVIVVAAVIGFAFVSCENGLMNSGYTMEFYTISASTYNTIRSGWTVEEGVGYAKRQSGTQRLESTSGDSIDGVRNWLNDYLTSSSDVNQFITGLQQSGSNATVGPVSGSALYGLIYVKEN